MMRLRGGRPGRFTPVAGLFVLIGAMGAAWLAWHPAPLPEPPAVTIPAGDVAFRPAGDFRFGNRGVNAPLRHEVAAYPLRAMIWHVTEADYFRCVAAKACRPADATGSSADHPVTGVSFLDATAYAGWFAARTGQDWRLPSDRDWVRLAAERAPADLLIGPSDDPSRRWLERYRDEAAQRGAADGTLRQSGSFGRNSLGVADLGGNVWEWTTACQIAAKVNAAGTVLESQDYCGVRVVEGRHRTFLVDFIRNPRSGGCSAGLPPDFVGFRLVRDLAD